MKPIVFLGGGRITSALIAGLRVASFRGTVVVHDRNPAKLRALKKQYGVSIGSDLQRAVDLAHILIIAVRPASIGQLLRDIGTVSRPVVAVSLAAGVPLSKLRNGLGRPVRWARAMPSPVARGGHGLSALTFERGFPPARRREIRRFFGMVGAVVEIPESRFDAFTVTYSSSHGYHALANLAAASQKLGLDRKIALTAAAHALADGILSWRENKTSLDALIHEAATPGGIAAAVMGAMDRDGYRDVIEAGLRAGMKRAKGNATL